MATLPANGGLVVSTLPAGGMDTGKNGLFVRANKDVVVVAFRDTVAAVAQRSAVAAGACSVLHVWADAGRRVRISSAYPAPPAYCRPRRSRRSAGSSPI